MPSTFSVVTPLLKKKNDFVLQTAVTQKMGPKMISLIDKTSKYCINKSHVIQCID